MSASHRSRRADAREPIEHLQVGRFGYATSNEVAEASRANRAAAVLVRLRMPKATVIERICSETGECGVRFLGWNGDSKRGWGFYCACGYCTPMARSFSEGMDKLEQHWQSGRPA